MTLSVLVILVTCRVTIHYSSEQKLQCFQITTNVGLRTCPVWLNMMWFQLDGQSVKCSDEYTYINVTKPHTFEEPSITGLQSRHLLVCDYPPIWSIFPYLYNYYIRAKHSGFTWAVFTHDFILFKSVFTFFQKCNFSLYISTSRGTEWGRVTQNRVQTLIVICIKIEQENSRYQSNWHVII